MKQIATFLIALLAATALQAQTLNRSALNGVVNSAIIDNQQQRITPKIARDTLLSIILNMANPNDSQAWSGTNTFTGPATFSGPTSLPVYAQPSVWPTDPRYNAICNGGGDDSVAFTNALAANNVLTGSTLQTCLVKNLMVASRQTLDCHGAVLQAAPGAQWIVKKTGFASFVRNCIFNDPTLTMMQTTTLSGGISPGVSVLPVNSTAGFQINMIATVQLASGAYWTSKITAVDPVGHTITIVNPIPSTVTGVAAGTAGTGYANGDAAVIIGGVGPPATVDLTVVAGGITGGSLDAPGLYQTAPAATVAVFDPKTPAALSGTLNLTYGGALIGAFVDASFGALVIDNANGGGVENVTVSEAPVGVEMLASTTQTTQEFVHHLNVNAAPIAGIARLSSVNDTWLDHVVVSGFAHHASLYGATGFYLEGNNRTFPDGGNSYGVIALGFESGLLDFNGQLDTFDHAVFDTNRNYAALCIGCSRTTFPYLWATFTGPNALSSLGSTAGKGIGVYFGSSPLAAAINNSITILDSSNNASDLHFGDASGSVKVGSTWGPSKFMTATNGASASLYSGLPIMVIPTVSVGGLASPRYLAPGAISATQTVATNAVTRGQATSMFASSSIAPGADTYTASLQVNRWSGSAYLGWAEVGRCTWTGAATSCAWNNSGAFVSPQDQVDIAMTASSGTFVASQTLNVYVGGL